MEPRVLFILKQRPLGTYGAWNYSNEGKGSSGLYVSALQVVEALVESDIIAESVVVVDNNAIDREVKRFKPTHVIIEAFWVVPEKFDVLMRLHPNVQWVVRNHSKTDFLANEGSAMGWALDYLRKGVILACNSKEATKDFQLIAASIGADEENVAYLPNYYAGLRDDVEMPNRFLAGASKVGRELGFSKLDLSYFEGEVNIGCFGAIRPLKNHLNQAIAAMHAADDMELKLNFHINSNRIEGNGDPALKNMRSIFDRHPVHELVEHEWMPHDGFLRLVSGMDVVMQVSISETFNIVAADAVSVGVPVLVSHEIPWLDNEYRVTPNDPIKIAHRLIHILKSSDGGPVPFLQLDQYGQLLKYVHEAKDRWLDFLEIDSPI